MPDALIIFVRNPELGKVKTRLAKTVGDNKALDIYKQLLQHTLDITINLAIDKYVFYADEIPGNDMWKNDRYCRLLQKNEGLGEKMLHAFQLIFNKQYEKVIIIGSDCIELTQEIISNAFDSLDDHDVVIGPANDGGYYLLGMKKVHEILFINKQWSTDNVFDETVKDLKHLRLRFHKLPQLIDIDTEEDWLLATKSEGK